MCQALCTALLNPEILPIGNVITVEAVETQKSPETYLESHS